MTHSICIKGGGKVISERRWSKDQPSSERYHSQLVEGKAIRLTNTIIVDSKLPKRHKTNA